MSVPRLSAFLDARGLTQAEFAASIGVTAPAVNRYVNGERQPKRRVGERLLGRTFGMIHPANCAELITEAEAAEMMAEIERREAAAKAGEVARG